MLHKIRPVRSHVPQSSVLGPFLYQIFTADIPQLSNTTIATYVGDTAILFQHQDASQTSAHLQARLSKVELKRQKLWPETY